MHHHSQKIAAALDVLANPDKYANAPVAYQAAWLQMKKARGETVNFDRVGPMAHKISRAPAPNSPGPNGVEQDFQNRAPRISKRIRARAAALGLHIPARAAQ